MPGEIVKVQRPLNRPGPWMVYDSRRNRLELLDPPPKDLVAKMPDLPKAYFDAVWTGARWVFGARVRDQAW